MPKPAPQLGGTTASGRWTGAEREILDVAGLIGMSLAGVSEADHSAASVATRRLAAISTTLQAMATARARRRGWPPVRGRFPYEAMDLLSESSREDAIRRLDRWISGHGDDDPLGDAYELLLETDGSSDERGEFRLVSRPRTRRKASGSFYTPSPLVGFVLERSLDCTLAARIRGRTGPAVRDALLSLRVLDPAAGGGRFLVEAARRIAAAVGPTSADRDRTVLRDVLRSCIYGIEIDPVAAEICRINLCFASGGPEVRPEEFTANIRVGDALIGATRSLVAGGIPDEALRPRIGDDREVCATLRRRNREERRSFPMVAHAVNLAAAADAWCSAFLDGKTATAVGTTTADLVRAGGLTSRESRAEGRFLHPECAFPEVFAHGGFDVIVGNPPFLNQLESTTAAERARAAFLRYVSHGAIRGYADTSAAFLERCSHWLAEGGRMALIQPHSVLAARDSEAIRTSVLVNCALRELWVAGERVFPSANVHVCLPVLERIRERRGVLARFAGADFRRLSDVAIDQDILAASGTWAPLAAAAAGVPEVSSLDDHPAIGTLADATADFRDQYYGLDGFLVDDADVAPADRTPERFPPLVTTGLIDLAECRWGIAPTRVLKRKWLAPRIDRRRMARDGTLEPWIAARSRPKILLATQTRILEAFVDSAGTLVPGLPLITVVPHRPDDLWLVAAALASPVATAVAFCRYAGVALTVDAIKLSAAQVQRLPLPGEGDAERASWVRGADELRRAHAATIPAERGAALRAFGHAMARAYGLSETHAAEVERWWTARLSSEN